MRWTQTADRRDESTPPELQCVLLKEERLEMHSTHHNQLKVSSYIYAQKKEGGCYFTTVEMKANKLRRLQKKKKVTWWLLPIFKPRGGSQTRLNWPWFHERAPFSTGSSFPLLRNLILIINPSTETGDMISCLSVQHSHSYILLYNWSLRSTESYHGHVIQHLDFNL